MACSRVGLMVAAVAIYLSCAVRCYSARICALCTQTSSFRLSVDGSGLSRAARSLTPYLHVRYTHTE